MCIVCCVSTHGNPASRWTGDFWSKRLLLIMANLKTFCFGPFSYFLGFWAFANQPTEHTVGELAGGGSVAVAVAFVTGDR